MGPSQIHTATIASVHQDYTSSAFHQRARSATQTVRLPSNMPMTPHMGVGSPRSMTTPRRMHSSSMGVRVLVSTAAAALRPIRSRCSRVGMRHMGACACRMSIMSRLTCPSSTQCARARVPQTIALRSPFSGEIAAPSLAATPATASPAPLVQQHRRAWIT